MASATTPFIDGRELSLVYRGAEGALVHALDSVSFAVGREQFAAIIGPSGCGKTTLLKVLGDLLEPTNGTVTIDGRPPAELRRERQIGNMFQDSVLLPWKTIAANIRFLSQIAGRPASNEQVRALAELVGIEEFLDKYPHELSGGMRQRAALARAYALEPTLLLMDEPFGALDAITRERMNDELLRIWGQRRNTVVLVTHSIQEAVYLSDVVFVMSPRPGRIVDVIEIDLPRPRTRDMRFDPRMTELVARVHESLYASMGVTA